MMRPSSALISILVMILILSSSPSTEACSCAKKHPQEHYCSADFVVLAHVKRMLHHHPVSNQHHHHQEWSRAYKVRIKKEFKVTESGRVALSYGRILTPSHGASCGIRLKPGRRYLLTGTIRSGKPWINLCHFVHDWDRLTPTQRKGFRRLYAAGCDCKVMECHWWMAGHCPPTTQACYWETAMDWHDCQSSHAICTRTKVSSGSSPEEGTCRWSTSRSYRHCSSKSLQQRSSAKNADDPAVSSSSISSSSILPRLWSKASQQLYKS